MRAKPARREAAIDALRALALLPVVVVNFTSYVNLPMGGPHLRPDGTVLGDLASGAVAAFLQGKGYPLLMFLFGYSLSLALRHRSPAQARRRLYGLLALGLGHGFLLYMGDILSAYALIGLVVLRWAPRRLRSVVRATQVAGGVALLLAGLMLAVFPSIPVAPSSLSLADHPSLGEWWQANAFDYLSSLLLGTLFLGPEVFALMGLGVLAQRLGWLRHRRWSAARQRCARWAGPLVLLNLGVGVAAVTALQADAGRADAWLVPLSTVLGPLSLLSWVSWFVQRWPHRGAPQALVDAGRQTLTPYLLSSAVAVGVWTQLGLGWRFGNAESVLFSTLLWAALMTLSRWATLRQRRLPAEAWLVRR
ncbi:DUF418 domain-containing protein [Inhella gelatinilytica]|uniref:DUF418 domain-containing protein n=1 Tax=Inhella gelatinilytica TaxID=2795030 RepID=A0A931IWR4_9BURK|nr:DUF418 domain-containing protein [Inhella gelatinilytica]MBH9552464.1 DUF418 domain-containing protein [Inhella gelatinilytica]